ncbi:MAG: xanthine dehydrogenase family protein subunit M [bacterium]|nr:xanthine dehydrogenase family protein subunit M [bacterium]
MKNFTLNQPKNLKEAGQVFKTNPEAMPVAGCTDVLGLMKDGIFEPDELVDLKKLPGMNKITYSRGKGLSIGPLAKLSDVAEHPDILRKYPVLAEAAVSVASPQLRNMGTIGGNICQRPRCWYFRGEFPCLRKGGKVCFSVGGENQYHCVVGGGPCFIVHPSDTAVALLALDATLVVSKGKKKRKLPLTEFFVLPEDNPYIENVLKPGELITEILVPDAGSDMHSRWVKFTERDVWDFAIVSGAVVWHGSEKQVKSGRLVLGGVAPVPWIEKEVTKALTGASLDEKTVNQLAEKTLNDADPMSQNSYKVPLAQNLVRRLLS